MGCDIIQNDLKMIVDTRLLIEVLTSEKMKKFLMQPCLLGATTVQLHSVETLVMARCNGIFALHPTTTNRRSKNVDS